jgi:hypothetical protein
VPWRIRAGLLLIILVSGLEVGWFLPSGFALILAGQHWARCLAGQGFGARPIICSYRAGYCGPVTVEGRTKGGHIYSIQSGEYTCPELRHDMFGPVFSSGAGLFDLLP